MGALQRSSRVIGNSFLFFTNDALRVGWKVSAGQGGKSDERVTWSYHGVHNSAILSVETPLQHILSNSSIFLWGKHSVNTDMIYDNVSFHPNLVLLTLSSSLMPSLPVFPLPCCSLTKHMPTASATCLAKKASEQTTPPTVAWRWFYQTHPAKATIMVSWQLFEEAITCEKPLSCHYQAF